MSTLLSPLAPGEELIDPESFHRLYAGIYYLPGWRPEQVASPVAIPAATPPATPESMVLELEACSTRRDVEQVATRHARTHAEAAALLHVRRGRIQAMCWDPEPPRTPGPIYWTTRPFMLAAVLERRRVWRGAPAKDPLTRRIVRSLGRSDAHEIGLFPIFVHERLVALLYADAGGDRLAAASMGALEVVCERVSLAWERMIIARRRDGTG